MHFTLFHVMSFVSCHSICCIPFIYFKSFHSCHAVLLVSLMSDIGFIMFHLIHFSSFHSFHAYHFLSFHFISSLLILVIYWMSSHLSRSFHFTLFRFVSLQFLVGLFRFLSCPFVCFICFTSFLVVSFLQSFHSFHLLIYSVSFGSFITFIRTLILSVNLVCFHVVSLAPQGQFFCTPQQPFIVSYSFHISHTFLWATLGHWLPSFETSPSAGSDTSASQHCHGMVPTSEAKWNKSITWCQ